MMRVETVTFREIRLPLREPFRISSGTVSERRILLAELHDGDGTTAWSECVAGEQPNYSYETIDTAWLSLRAWFAPRLLGSPLDSPAAADALLQRGVQGHRMARATLEMGVWGLAARRAALPLARLIGGTRDRVETGISLGIQASPEALVQRARQAMREGYRKIKMKISPVADVEYVAAVRAALGPTAPLMVDANNAYTLADADRLLRLDDFDLIMVEQPLDGEDLVAHAQLQKRMRTPVCLDESITSPARAADMIALGSGRIINIKPGRVGGFAASIRIHDLCARHGLPVWCGGMLESGIGRAFNVALASLPNFTIPGDVSPSRRYWERDIVSPPWTMAEPGFIAVPLDQAGIGVRVDVDLIDDLTVRAETLNA
jgi:o-succinylbenzoate synthase